MRTSARTPAEAPLIPSRLTPSVSTRPWGGGRFGVVDGIPVGELWVSGDEATLPDGRTLAEAGLAADLPLVKLLDIGGTLSVQVHPDDATARALHGPGAVGKHECWVVLEAPPAARVALGLVAGASVEDLFSSDERRITAALRMLPVAAGSVLDIPPGTVHAPAGGLLLYEIQQRSDLTYRIWDWGRPRPLHLAASRRAIHPASDPRVTSLPVDAGLSAVSDPAAPFRLEACRLAAADGPLAFELVRPAVVSVIEGTLRLGGEAAETDPSLEGDPLEAASHWLLPVGRWSLRGSGRAFIATA
jgi:mannose-6-phosphate isomerase